MAAAFFSIGFSEIMVRWSPSIRAIKGFSGSKGKDDRAFFLDPSLKPKQVETYTFSKDEVLSEISWYHICQASYLLLEESVSSGLNKIKSSIDSEIPIVLNSPAIHHALTIIGYYESDGKTYLVCYDNKDANSTRTCIVEDEKILYGSTELSKAQFIDPYSLPPPYSTPVLNLIGSAFTNYFGLQIHSPVDVNVTSESGKQLLVKNNIVTRNDFEDSYVYIGESKIFLLPSIEEYSVEAVGTSSGNVSIDCVFVQDDEIIINQFQNITINYGSGLTIDMLQSEVLYFDSDGDQTTDREITATVIPEFPILRSILVLFIMFSIVVVAYKRKLRTN